MRIGQIAKRTTVATSIAVFLVAFVLSYCCAAQSSEGYSGVLMLFPVANRAGEQAAHCTGDMYLLIKERLSSLGKVQVIAYDPRNVSVERMIREQRLDERAAMGDFGTDEEGQNKARRIALETGVQLVTLTSLDKYLFDAERGSLEIGGTLLLVDVQTGAVRKRVSSVVTARSGAEGVARSEGALAVEAITELVGRFFAKDGGVQAVDLGVSVQEDVVPAQAGSKDKNFLSAMIAALLLGLLLGRG